MASNHPTNSSPSSQCVRCGFENRPGAKFCARCGAPQPINEVARRPAPLQPVPRPSAPAQRRAGRCAPIVLAAIVGVVMICACLVMILGVATSSGVLRIALGASPTPTATATPTFRPTPTPTYTATATATRSSTPTRTPTLAPSATPIFLPMPASIIFKYDDGVAQDQRDLIQNGVALGQADLGDAGPVTVFAYANFDALAAEADTFYKRSATSESSKNFREMFSTGKWIASGGSGAIWVWVSDQWKQRSMASKDKTLIHEYFHIVQSWLAKKGVTATGPIWLYEGAADIAAYGSAAKLGELNLDEVRADKITQSRGMLSPLSSMITLQDTQIEDTEYPYQVGYLAIDYLLSKYRDERWNVLRKYWEAQGKGTTWQDAFRTTFGMSVDEFYPKFEEYRRAQFPPFCGTVGAPLAQATPALFGVQFVRQLAPGEMPRSDAPWSNPPNIPYIFCAAGTKLPWLPNSVYKFPTGSAGWVGCGANCITIYMRATTAPGQYTFAVQLPDGQHAETTFNHVPNPVTATPRP